MAQIQKVAIKVTTTGSAGSATGDGDSAEIVNGFVLGWNIDFHASAPSTTDVAVKTLEPTVTLSTISNVNTDAYYSTMKQIVDASGAAVTGVYTFYPVSGKIRVSVTGCNELTDAVTVVVFVAPN